jgi:protein-S-isoprenylcysteine O-methyltransferase Ste14
MATISPQSISAALWIVWTIYWLIAARFAAATQSSEGLLGRLGHLIPLYVGFFLLFYDPVHPLVGSRWPVNRAVRYAGDAVTAGGLLFAVWARIHLGRYWSGIITLKEGHRLIKTGPYHLVRHPIYTGMLTGMIGSLITIANFDAALGLVLVTAAFLIKLRREENLLVRQFGDEYRTFQAHTPALIPFLPTASH